MSTSDILYLHFLSLVRVDVLWLHPEGPVSPRSPLWWGCPCRRRSCAPCHAGLQQLGHLREPRQEELPDADANFRSLAEDVVQVIGVIRVAIGAENGQLNPSL